MSGHLPVVLRDGNRMAVLIIWTVVILQLVDLIRAENKTNMSIPDFIESLLTSDIYDYRVRPDADKGIPTVVRIDIFINGISSLDEMSFDYSVDIFLRQRWNDPRLAYTKYNHSVALNYNQVDRLWQPDLFITNEKEAIFHDLPVPNRLIRISPNGDILYSQRLTLKLSCILYLKKYPFDNQTCSIQLESYGYTTEDIIFQWHGEHPVQLGEQLKLPEFVTTGTFTGDCTAVYVTGTFTCIFGHIFLQRQIEYYVIQIFIPSILIVVLSWVSFWIDMYAVPARITLGLLTVLTMTTQTSGINQRIARVSYIKSIDVWMSTCLVFVFGALVEYALVNVLARKHQNKAAETIFTNLGIRRGDMEGEKQRETMRESIRQFRASLQNDDKQHNVSIPERDPQNGLSEENSGTSVNQSSIKIQPDKKLPKKKKNPCLRCLYSVFEDCSNDNALLVDVIARIVFPAAFVVFNSIYWTVYITMVT